ncbi:MAG: penicillin-binding protein 2 [Zoogloeaceae bacterium]|jgi:cell division protein FtsI (penicillin-binding protein 3)|nr:penicillin-binding protein 2 [Zoogloeaceae bacterium]
MSIIRRRRAVPRPHRFTENPLLQLALPAWRSRFVGLALMFLFLLLLGAAFYLQVINNAFLQGEGNSRYRRDLEVSASRGKIADRNGDLLAISAPMKSIWAIPADVQLEPAERQNLAKLLDMEVKELDRRLAAEKSFVYLQRQVAPEVAARIADLKLSGIHQDGEFRRFYPAAEMVAHLVGFTGVDDQGLEGVELAFQNELMGTPGHRTVIRDRRGQIVEDVEHMRPPLDGRDIRLALDSKIQYLAFSAIKQAAAEYQAKAISAVVLDARTGEVLALANWPSYNPNNRANRFGPQLRNRAVTDSFEPGSIMKPFTVALALDKGHFRFDSLVDTGAGRLTIGNATISDTHAYGTLTVAQVIQKSSNVGTVKIASAFQPREMWDMFDALGFGAPLDLGFPGEVGGRLRPWKNWRPIEQATMSYGHGISASLAQLAHAYLVFARDGDLVPLSLRLRDDNEPVRGAQIFSPQTAREVRAMLEMVVAPGGTAPRAQVPGYRVGGKTGTAYKIEGGVYAQKYVASFVGIAPMSDPRLVVAVMVDEPTRQHYGGTVAAPVFAQITAGALRTLGVVPDMSMQVAALPANAAEVTP